MKLVTIEAEMDTLKAVYLKLRGQESDAARVEGFAVGLEKTLLRAGVLTAEQVAAIRVRGKAGG